MVSETRAGILPTQWKVFLDGVEVPHHGFSVSMGQDQVSEATISLEPDVALLALRPQTLVHIFAKERFPDTTTQGPEEADGSTAFFGPAYESDEAELKAAWYLFWEGEVSGRTHQKSKGTRSIQVPARALTGMLARTQAFMLGIGGIEYSAVIGGSKLPSIVAGTMENGGAQSIDSLSLLTLSDLFAEVALEGTDIADRDSESPRFSERLLRLITYLSSHSGILRQQLVRSRLLNKIGSVPDDILSTLLGQNVLRAFLAESQNRLTAQSTVMDVIRHVMSYGFYHMLHIPFPHRPAEQPKGGESIPTFNTLDEQQQASHKIPYEYFRNDFMFMPETYYALPPPCNFIFPDQLADMTIGRAFDGEPTRHLIHDPHLALLGTQYVFWMAPNDIIRRSQDEEPGTTSGSLFSIASGFGRGISYAGDNKNSPYAYPDDGDASATTGHSLLGALSDLELEKGIVPSFGQNQFEAFAALAYVGRQLPTSATTAADDSVKDVVSPENAAYVSLMTELANYQLQMMRYRRQGSVSLLGHRWIIPGLPTIIFDSDISYMAHVMSTTLTVTAEGHESTTLQLDRTRPVPREELSTLQATLKELSDKIQELKDQQDSAAEAATAASSSLGIDATLGVDSSYENLGPTLATLRTTLEIWSAWFQDNSLPVVSTTGTTLKPNPPNPPDTFDMYTIAFQDLSSNASSLQSGLDKLLVDGASVTQKMYSGALSVSTSGSSTTLSGVDQSQTFSGAAISPAYFAYLFLGTYVTVDLTGQITSAKQVLGDGFNVNALRAALGAIVTGGAVDDLYTGGVPPNSILGARNIVAKAQAYYGLARAALDSWLQIQKQIAESGENLDLLALPPSAQDAASSSYQDTVDTITADIQAKGKAVLEDLETRLDWPAPPAFFSAELTKVDKLDSLYQNTFGCSKFYTGPYAATATSQAVADIRDALTALDLGPVTGKETGLSIQDQLDYYLEYLSGVSALNNVYPILEGGRETVADVTPPPSWEDVSQAGGGYATPFEWEHRTFLKREATTLGDFLKDHRLELVTQFSDPPTTYAFYQMKPTAGSTRPATEAGLVFDDSIFSKLVDEKRLTAAGSDETPTESDPMIEKAREQATGDFLTTKARQEIILSYARKHFGTRGFDGT
jgi:hypothetical protein